MSAGPHPQVRALIEAGRRGEAASDLEAERAAGVRVRLDRYDDMVHGFLRWGGVVDRARELIDALGEHARAAIAGPGPGGAPAR